MTPTLTSGRPFIVCLALALAAAVSASAHTENSEGFSTIRVRANHVSYDLFLDYFELARVVPLGAPRQSPPAVLGAALHDRRQELAAYLAPRLQVSLDGVGCALDLAESAVERRFERDYAHLRLEFDCPGSRSGRVRISYQLLFDDSDPSHRNLVSSEVDGGRVPFVFTVRQRELSLGEGSRPGQARRFVELGLHHILGGYDHLLFVTALLLGATRLVGVAQVLSLFTLAHSLTLAAAWLGLAQFPARIVEPLIALSIAYVAAESFSPGPSRFRLPVVFGFGLVHGMGFAGALQVTGARGWDLALPLLSFNVGIELGQGLLVLAVFPLLMGLRRLRCSRLVHGLSQGAIAVFGLFWYFERLLS
jgi:hypothetical protein